MKVALKPPEKELVNVGVLDIFVEVATFVVWVEDAVSTWVEVGLQMKEPVGRAPAVVEVPNLVSSL